MSITVALVGSGDRELVPALRQRGYKASDVMLQELDAAHPPGSKGPDAFVFDIRELDRLPREVGHTKKTFPATGIVIVARARARRFGQIAC